MATVNRITRNLAVSLLRYGSRRGFGSKPRGPTPLPILVKHRKRAFQAALIAFVALLGGLGCKPRDTGEYCQLPCEKVCRVSDEDVCVSPNDPRHGCASSTSCDECPFKNKNATGACDNDGKCTVGGCVTGFADCDGNDTNGCEVDYMSDLKNCGACGSVCPGPETHAEFKCAQGLCVATCRDGYKDCNKRSADGCEIGPDLGCDAPD